MIVPGGSDPELVLPRDRSTQPAVATTELLLATNPAGPPLQMIEAPSGGGGYLYLRDTYVQLTQLQLAFLRQLIAQTHATEELAAIGRGFVDTKTLLATLPWECRLPTENHVKQLVRRLRDLLAGAGIDDLIESRRGVGYRLRWGLHVPAAVGA